MITRCNRCGAKFEISANLVRSQDPTVRCGECLSIFDASANLIADDSINNYVPEPALDRRRTEKHRAAPVSAGVAVNNEVSASSYSADTVTTESVAHITAEDLENASTLVLDHSETENEISGSRSTDPESVTPGARVNDGFYSPDLDINQFESSSVGDQFKNTHEQAAAGQQSGKQDPIIDLGQSLDNTSLEFERTLALENFNEADLLSDPPGLTPAPASALTRSADLSAFSHTDTVDFNSERRTNITYDETVRFEQTNDHSDDYYQADGAPRGHGQATERSAELSTSEYTDTTITTGRDYPLLAEDLLDRNATANELHETHSDSLPTRPDALYSDNRQAGTADSGRPGRVQEDDFNESYPQDQDSARELRRYVSSRGGAVYPDESSAKNRQGMRSPVLPVLLVCMALAGVLYFARNVIATMNLPEPVVSVFCAVTGCELPAKKDVAQLELVRHQMFSHKTLNNVLVFSVDLVNRARFPQPYPVLVVTMANGTGESVAFRKFEPAEYLEDDPSLKTLPAGQPVRIKFEIVDPGPEALSSELSFE